MLLSFTETLGWKTFFLPAATLPMPLPVCETLSNSFHLLGFIEGCSRIQGDVFQQIAVAHLVVISTALPLFSPHTTVPGC